jgi:predicted nucleic acid-binding protein
VGDERLAAVADTGPLIHLAEVDSLMLLEVFQELHIPEAVWREAKRPPALRSSLVGVRRHVVDAAEVLRFTERSALERLQVGERECLLLCSQLDVPLLLTDDLAARDAARSLGITPVGSLGVVARAFRHGLIAADDAERRLLALAGSSTLFVTPAIVELALEELRRGRRDDG